MIPKLIRSFRNAGTGLVTAWREEINFRIEVILTAVTAIFAFILKLSSIECAILALTASFVLVAEIANTAIEDLADKVEPNYDPLIGKVKDMMSAAVLVSAISAAVITLVIFLPHLL